MWYTQKRNGSGVGYGPGDNGFDERITEEDDMAFADATRAVRRLRRTISGWREEVGGVAGIVKLR